MNRRLLIAIVPLFMGLAWAETEISAPEGTSERQETTSDQEWESKGVIPDGGLTVSTQPITPISILQEKTSYDQALEELATAQELLKKGKMEAASDVALQAYDDLMSFSVSRRNKKKRQKLRADRHQAATVYIDSSVAYIEEFMKKGGESAKVKEEGRARLADLRDVSQNYPELNKKLNKAFEPYAIQLSTSPKTSSPNASVGDPSRH